MAARIACAALLVCILTAQALAAAPEDLAALRSRALELVNESRQEHGLAPLTSGDALNQAAQAHAEDMAARSYFAHVSPQGGTVRDRFLAAGGGQWQLVAENIARCTNCAPPVTVERLERFHRDWMQSPEHRENILRPGLTRFGFGLALGEDRSLYAVQTFAGPGTPRGTPPGEAPTALLPRERQPQALQRLNQARADADVPPLAGSEALQEAARTIASRSEANGGDGGPAGDLFEALPEGQRKDWRSLSAVVGTCGGCGTRPTEADIQSFLKQWLDDPRYREMLLDRRFDHLGFALRAGGEGRKTAVAVLGARR